jgi:RNA polymerase sigma-70 factor, ECF subfamily
MVCGWRPFGGMKCFLRAVRPGETLFGEGTNSVAEMSHNIDDPGRPAREADSAVVAKCREGDIEAFGILVEKYQKKMLNIAYRMIGDYQEACEVTQEAFLSAFRAIKKFRGEASFSTWMTGIVLNQARSRVKQIKTRSRFEDRSLNDPVKTGEGSVLPDPPSGEMPMVAQMEKKDIQEAVQDCIRSLDPEYREVLVLRDIQEFSYEEIRDILKIPEGTVKSRLFRAREIFKERLKRRMGSQ